MKSMIFLLISLLLSEFAIGERRLLHCEVPEENSQNIIEGRPGKIGPKGDKGEPGLQGTTGQVDYDKVTEIIDKKLQDAGLASSMANFFELSLRHKKLLDILRKKELCRVRHNGLCYWVAVHDAHDMTFSDGKAICKGVDGEVAIVTDQQHYDKIASYIRTKIPYDLAKVYVWTALTLNPSTGEVRLPNNQRANFVKWWPGHPNSEPGETQMVLDIQKNADAHLQGMWAARPQGKIHGVLCQFIIS